MVIVGQATSLSSLLRDEVYILRTCMKKKSLREEWNGIRITSDFLHPETPATQNVKNARHVLPSASQPTPQNETPPGLKSRVTRHVCLPSPVRAKAKGRCFGCGGRRTHHHRLHRANTTPLRTGTHNNLNTC